jgi:hypothetical protein
MKVWLKVATTLSIIKGRKLNLVMSKVNLLFDQSFPNGKTTSKNDGQVKSVSEMSSILASLHFPKINIISSRGRYKMLVN